MNATDTAECPHCDPSRGVPNPYCPEHGQTQDPIEDPLVRLNRALDHAIAGMQQTLDHSKKLFDNLEDLSERCLKLAKLINDKRNPVDPPKMP